MITLAELDYELPPERIAQSPVRPRDAARLLVVDREPAGLTGLLFSDLPAHLGQDDLLIVNDTRVIPAKLRGQKESGGRAEALLLERRPDATWLALVKCTGRLRPGLCLRFGALRGLLEAIQPDGVSVLRFDSDSCVSPEVLLEKSGEAPLPPYIRREAPSPQDFEDYQTIFAQVPGAVAAPTASLHFTPELAARLPIAKVTLHIGPGTFRPLQEGSLDDHLLAPEAFDIPEATAIAISRARRSGGRVIAVGTSVVRALETTGGDAGHGQSGLFIRPGHRFRVVDSLITNFHLPRSTLLLLVMAFAGANRIRHAYAHAIAEGFRFYSYGDAMWIR